MAMAALTRKAMDQRHAARAPGGDTWLGNAFTGRSWWLRAGQVCGRGASCINKNFGRTRPGILHGRPHSFEG